MSFEIERTRVLTGVNLGVVVVVVLCLCFVLYLLCGDWMSEYGHGQGISVSALLRR